jgi:hypothetical protein
MPKTQHLDYEPEALHLEDGRAAIEKEYIPGKKSSAQHLDYEPKTLHLDDGRAPYIKKIPPVLLRVNSHALVVFF